MPIRWNVYRFDYTRYLRLRPALSEATAPADFAMLVESPETEAIVTALEDAALTAPQARSASLQALCCLGEPLPFNQDFVRLVATLGRFEEAEEGVEQLSELLAGGKNVEEWLKPASGMVGLLTPEETLLLSRRYPTLLRAGKRRSRRGGRSRKGGLVGSCLHFFRRLLDQRPRGEDMLRLLGELVAEAAEQGEGIVLYSA